MEKILTGSIRGMVKQQALWFIQREKERILHNYYNGTTSCDQAVGGLSTLYQMASHLQDTDCMKNLWLTISDLQNARSAGLRPPGTFETIGIY